MRTRNCVHYSNHLFAIDTLKFILIHISKFVSNSKTYSLNRLYTIIQEIAIFTKYINLSEVSRRSSKVLVAQITIDEEN